MLNFFESELQPLLKHVTGYFHQSASATMYQVKPRADGAAASFKMDSALEIAML
jgi:hypothetical protein